MTDPDASYSERLASRQTTVSQLASAIDRLGQWRMGVFLVTLASVGLVWLVGLVQPAWALLGFLGLIVLVIRSQVLAGRRIEAQKAVRYYQRGRERLAGLWMGRGPTGSRFVDPSHLSAADLDLFGTGSLFQRISMARTVAGEARLAEWLLAPSSTQEILSRQQAITELRDRLDLREYLAVTGDAVQNAVDLEPLVAWGLEPTRVIPNWRRWAIFGLGWFNVAAILGWLVADTTTLPVLVGLVLSTVAVWPLLGWSRMVIRPLEERQNDLPVLEAILARLDMETFTSARLVAIKVALSPDGVAVAHRIQELRSLAEWITARRNPLFIPIAIAMLWDVRMALKVDEWRRRHGPALKHWLAAVAELEALSSLAGYAFENPEDPFPEILPEGLPQFHALGLGHPLLPAIQSVRNDVSIGGPIRLLMVSGSNMSGKSTLLRSVGVNIVLALAGGPVKARQLSLTPVSLGATMRVQDSLQEGRSRFFAEVSRVRAVLDRSTTSPPLLFLFDELFAGTNSADRLLGAEAVLKTLIQNGAIGFITTHDLALTELSTRFGTQAQNVHFADQWTDGAMTFDYQMRPGVVPHGNGLALMRAVGLDV